MRIVTVPDIHILTTQVFHPHPRLHIPEDGSDDVKAGAFTAKVCYRSFPGRPNEVNQRDVKEKRHGKILQHLVTSIYVTGISRACGNELITHQAGVDISQESTRYVDQTKDGGFVLEPYLVRLMDELFDAGLLTQDMVRDPNTIPVHPNVASYEGNRLMIVRGQLIAANTAFHIYETQTSRLLAENPLELEGTELVKWARGKARNVLPLGLETSVVMTANLRAWRHFLEMRTGPDAEEEIRRLAWHLFLALREQHPLYFEDYTDTIVKGWPVLNTPIRKL